MGAEATPKIVIVDESPIRAAILEEGLREAGFTDVKHISEMQSLLARIYALDPDIIVIGAGVPSDQCVTGTISTLNCSGESRNCGLSMGGVPGRSAAQAALFAFGK